MSKYKHLSALEFGYEMLTWDSKWIYPLENVTLIKVDAEIGVFYVPAIQGYMTVETMVTAPSDGYKSQEKLMNYIGKCWDEDEQDVIRKIK